MKVYMLKGPSGSGKSTWADQQKNAVIVERYEAPYIVQAALQAVTENKDIIFDGAWNPTWENHVGRCFEGYAEVIVKDFYDLVQEAKEE